MRTPTEQVRHIHLDHEQLLVLDGGREGRVRVVCGGVWLTEAGERQDTFLRTGHVAGVHGRRAVVQAEGEADLEFITLGRPAPTAWWRRLRALAARWQLGPEPEACA